VRLAIWDTAGRDGFRVLAPLYARGASAGVGCFDVTDAASFTEAGAWTRLFQESAETDAVVVLVGNKADVAGERRVAEDAAREWVGGAGAVYVEVSAKTGESVDLLFAEVAARARPTATTDCLGPPVPADGVKGRGC
jgi:small GTP-binding protein